eukprot:gene3170-3448_t
MTSRADAEFATQQLHSIISELRADPALAPLLDDSIVAQAIREVAADPVNMQKYRNNSKVMGVLERLLSKDLPARQAAAFAEAGISPGAVLAAMTSDDELQSLLKEPSVRRALAQIRANPAAGMARWSGDPLVSATWQAEADAKRLEALSKCLEAEPVPVVSTAPVQAEEQRKQQPQQRGRAGGPSSAAADDTAMAIDEQQQQRQASKKKAGKVSRGVVKKQGKKTARVKLAAEFHVKRKKGRK